MTTLGEISFLQASIYLKLIHPDKAREILRQLGEETREAPPPSLRQFILQEGHLTSLQVKKISLLVQQGYLLCFSCELVYPLPGRGQEKKRLYQCQKCNRPLEPPPTPTLSTSETNISDKTLSSFQEKDRRRSFTPTISALQPESLEPYSVVDFLGEGELSRVYEVQDPLSGRSMVLKVLLPEKIKTEEERDFLREIQITSILEHPGITPIYDSGYLQDGSLFLATKKLEGTLLQDLLALQKKKKGKNLSLKELLEIFLKICDGLDYAHSKGVAHLSLTSRKVLVGNFGEVTLLDWGKASITREIDQNSARETSKIARPLEEKSQALSPRTPSPETAGYLAPEQVRGEKGDQKSDIYSLGALFYEILALDPLFVGSPENRLEKTLQEMPLPPEKRRPHLEIPLDLSAIAMKALEKEPRKRYQEVKELKEDVGRFLDGYSVSVREDSPWESLVKWARRNKGLSTGLGVCALAIVLSILAGIWWKTLKREEKMADYWDRAKKILSQKEILRTQELEREYKKSPRHSERAEKLQKKREESLRLYITARSALEKSLEFGPKNQQLRKKLCEVEKEIGRLALLGGNYLLSRLSFERCIHLGDEKGGKKLLLELEKQQSQIEESQRKKINEIMKVLSQNIPTEGELDEYATEIVRMTGQDTTRKLLEYLESKNREQRRLAILCLGKRGDGDTRWKGKDTVEWLLQNLEGADFSKDSSELEDLIWALGRLRDNRATQRVYELRHKSGWNSPFWLRTELPFRWLPLPAEKDLKKPEEWYLQGRMKLDKNQYSEALKDFTRTLKLDSQFDRAYLSRGIAWFRQGKFQKALEDYTKAISLNPKDPAAYVARGDLHREQDHPQKALKDYTKALALNNRWEEAYLGRGKVLLHRLDIKGALADFTKALSLNPRSVRGYYARGQALLKKWDLPGALADFTQALALNPKYAEAYLGRGDVLSKEGDNKGALEDLNRSIELDPRQPLAYLRRGVIQARLGNRKEALEDLNQSLHLAPNLADGYVERARLRSRQRDYKGAVEDYTRAISLDSKKPSFYRSRAWEKEQLKDYRGALEDYTKAISLEGKSTYYYSCRAGYWLRRGSLEKAMEDYGQIIALWPKDSYNYYRRGKVWTDHQRWKEALKDFTKAIDLSPKNILYYISRGNVWSGLNKHQEAIKDYTKVITLYPTYVYAYHYRALEKMSLKDYKGALEDFGQAILQDPKFYRAYYFRGTLYLRERNWSGALEDFSEAIGLSPGYAPPYKARGYLLRALGRTTEAVKDFKTFLKLDPKDPDKEELKKYITQYGGK